MTSSASLRDSTLAILTKCCRSVAERGVDDADHVYATAQALVTEVIRAAATSDERKRRVAATSSLLQQNLLDTARAGATVPKYTLLTALHRSVCRSHAADASLEARDGALLTTAILSMTARQCFDADIDGLRECDEWLATALSVETELDRTTAAQRAPHVVAVYGHMHCMRHPWTQSVFAPYLVAIGEQIGAARVANASIVFKCFQRWRHSKRLRKPDVVVESLPPMDFERHVIGATTPTCDELLDTPSAPSSFSVVPAVAPSVPDAVQVSVDASAVHDTDLKPCCPLSTNATTETEPPCTLTSCQVLKGQEEIPVPHDTSLSSTTSEVHVAEGLWIRQRLSLCWKRWRRSLYVKRLLPVSSNLHRRALLKHVIHRWHRQLLALRLRHFSHVQSAMVIWKRRMRFRSLLAAHAALPAVVDRGHAITRRVFSQWLESRNVRIAKRIERRYALLRVWQHWKRRFDHRRDRLQNARKAVGTRKRLLIRRAFTRWKVLFFTAAHRNEVSLVARQFRLRNLFARWAWRHQLCLGARVRHEDALQVAQRLRDDQLLRRSLTVWIVAAVRRKDFAAADSFFRRAANPLLCACLAHWIRRLHSRRSARDRARQLRRRATLDACWKKWQERRTAARADGFRAAKLVARSMQLWYIRFMKHRTVLKHQASRLGLNVSSAVRPHFGSVYAPGAW